MRLLRWVFNGGFTAFPGKTGLERAIESALPERMKGKRGVGKRVILSVYLRTNMGATLYSRCQVAEIIESVYFLFEMFNIIYIIRRRIDSFATVAIPASILYIGKLNAISKYCTD